MGRSRILAPRTMASRTLAPRTMTSRVPALVVVALAVGGLLAGCALSATPAPSVTKTQTSVVTPTPTFTAAPAPVPAYDPKGSAQENKVYFDLVNTRFFAANPSALGRPIIDNLVAAGFPKSDMQVTPDRTSIGIGADSILFAVKIGDSCLLGQWGSGTYSSSVEAALTTAGPCLIGITRPITW
jgi:hypothetical protein